MAGVFSDLKREIRFRFKSQGGMILENQMLKQENERLKVVNMQLNEVLKENERLAQALDFQKKSGWNLKLARVVGKDPSNWWKTIVVNCGTLSGIKTNQVVLGTVNDGAALVGRVFQVGLTESKIVLVGDPNCLVSVVVEETRNSGILQPLVASPPEPSLVMLSYLSGNTELRPDYKIYTSGMGKTFPAGIYVGTVADTMNTEYGVHRNARVRLAIDASVLEEVWILMND